MKRILRGTELPEIPGILGGLKTGNKGGPGGFREIPDHPPRPVCSLDICAQNKHENMHFFGFPLINSLFCIALFWLGCRDIANWRRILGNSGNFRGLLKILDREFQGL